MNTAALHEAMDDTAAYGSSHVTSIDLERVISDKMRPVQKAFVVSVRRDGIETKTEVYADSWFEAWSDALDKNHGGDGCRIVVRPA